MRDRPRAPNLSHDGSIGGPEPAFTMLAVTADPVLDRRRRIAGLVSLGQRAGYALFGLAIALFVVGLVSGFGGLVSTAIVACIVVGSIVLAPAIVFGYAVRAAEREDREQGRPTMDSRED